MCVGGGEEKPLAVIATPADSVAEEVPEPAVPEPVVGPVSKRMSLEVATLRRLLSLDSSTATPAIKDLERAGEVLNVRHR